MSKTNFMLNYKIRLEPRNSPSWGSLRKQVKYANESLKNPIFGKEIQSREVSLLQMDLKQLKKHIT